MSTPHPTHHVGKIVHAVSARLEDKQTEPPKRYTEASLIADMLAAHKFAKTEEERAILKETEGLGTSRTREPTITAHIRRGMLESKKKGKEYEITSSSMAKATIDALPEILTSVATTAKWEVAFKMVQRGQASPEQIKTHLASTLTHLMSLAKEKKGKLQISIGNSSPNLASSGLVLKPKEANKLTAAVPTGSAKTASSVGSSIKKWF